MKIYLNNYSRQNSAFPCAKGNKSSSFRENEGFLTPKIQNVTRTALTFNGLNTQKAINASGGFISGAKKFYAKHFMTEGVIVTDYSKLARNTDALVGEGFLKSRIEEFQNLAGEDASRFIQLDGNKLTIYDRKVSGKLLSGILDVAKLPLDILGAGIKGMAKLPFIRNTKLSESLNNISFIKKRSAEKASMDLFYKIKGAASLKDSAFKIREKILSVPAGNAVGNYNTKDERGLNRLATGAISSFFVGMDFFNLVMYEKNNKEEAQEAAKKRRNRELMRIGINAFMTYSVLGALSSYANKSKAFACAAIAGSALFAEVITRIIAGTPLLPLSPEGAKKYNQERLKKQEKEEQKPVEIQNTPQNKKLNPFNPGVSEVFSEFTSYAASLNKNITSQNTNKTEKGENPITLNKIAFAVAAAALANIAFGAARTKIPKMDAFIKRMENNIAEFYKKHSTKDLIVDSKTLRKLLDGFEGNNSDSIKQAYSRILDVCFTEQEVQRLMKASKDGVIRITNDDKIFSKAFRRTSISNVESYTKMLSTNHPDTKYKKTSKMLVNEITGISRIRDIDKNGTKGTYQKFESIDFQIDFDNPKIINGTAYYPMKNAEYNFGRIKETKTKILLDAVSYPFKAIKSIITAPSDLLKKLSGVPTNKELRKLKKEAKADPFPIPDIGELFKDCSFMFKKYENGKISKEEFAKYMDSVNTKLLNMDTTPTYPQTALASLSRNFVTLITSYFFINDFRNEVLIQSNGENVEKAKEVTNERIAHKLSNFVLNKFFMELFNNTFQKYYLGSLAGATAVATATELTNESCVRLSIGVPIGNKGSREEIQEFEKKHLEKKGLIGAYYRLMARLTGKKMLSEKAESK